MLQSNHCGVNEVADHQALAIVTLHRLASISSQIRYNKSHFMTRVIYQNSVPFVDIALMIPHVQAVRQSPLELPTAVPRSPYDATVALQT